MHCFCLTLFPQRAQPDLLLLVVLCVVIAMRNLFRSRWSRTRGTRYRGTRFLRTVPTKEKGFYARLGPSEKLDLCKCYWNPQRKIRVATHCFEIISFESQQKCWHQHFWRRKGYFFRDFLGIRLYIQKSKRICKDL